MKRLFARQINFFAKSLPFLFLSIITVELTAQITPVGSGSYTTQLPPADAAGRNRPPNGDPRLSGFAQSKPIPTSDWWTGLLTSNDANLYNYPLSMRGSASGLVLSYTFLGSGVNDTRQPMGPEQPIVLGVSGLSGTYPTVSNYTDWTVTASWRQGNSAFDAVLGMGMPFVYCTKGSTDVASVTINMGTVTVTNEMILVTNAISGANFAIYAPVGSTWVRSGNTYTSTLAGKNYFSAAMLPTGANAQSSANSFKDYAYVFPANTNVSWQYNEATSVLQSVFTTTPDVKEGNGNIVLQGLLPHQWSHLTSSSAQPGNTTYPTARGSLKLLTANSFTIENTFKGILSAIPNGGKYSTGFNPAALNEKIDLVKNNTLETWTDSYNEGLVMNRLVQVAKIADQMGNIEARDQMINTVKTRIENWLEAKQGENAFLFHYDTKWKTLIGYPAGHSSDANINDHHFHYGYFINVAAAIEQFQPGWAANWGGMIELLINDAANPDRTSTQFPFLRHFNPFAGHAFAAGLLNNEPHGNNQESSSESMNFNASLIHWGTITGNKSIRDLGIYLYTTEQTAIEEYWFDMSNRNFPANYGHLMASRVWGNGIDRNTFWTGDIAAMYGINMFPTTGSSLYLGHNKTYAQQLWNEMTTKTGVLSNVANDNLWYETYWSYLSFINPSLALSLYNNHPNYKVKFGNSDAHAYHWLHAFNGLGTIESSITANHPIAVVFSKNGDKTYVAQNYSASPITVTYSDGYTMMVPARTLKTSKDIDVTATIASSATEVATNGAVNLTTTITGTGVTKVVFFEGANELGTVTTAPYNFSVNNLAAKVHSFYAVVYVGTAVQQSNVVKVVVGAQLPYLNNIISIPSQSIEAGNYDVYEGGIGQNISYFDVSATNEASTTFRTNEYVDASTIAGEGNTVSYIAEGEWLEYTVNIEQAGTYDLAFRYASGNPSGGGPFHIEIDGKIMANNITVAFTNANWNTWATKTVTGIILPAGKHIIRLVFDKAGFNIGRLSFTYKGSASPFLNIPSNTLQIDAFANSKKSINLTSNINWSASSDQSWLNVSPASGFADATINFTAQENTTTQTRVANITFSGNGVSNTILTITQDAGGVAYLLVNPTTLLFQNAANTPQNIAINSNTNWTATSNQTWLTLSATSGNGVANITANASNHTGSSNRTATITISAAGLPDRIITVSQNGAPIAITLPIDFEADGTYTFTNFDGGTGLVVANPLSTGENTSSKVGRIIRNGGATWAGSFLTVSQNINFSSLSTFAMKVLVQKAGVPILLKLEGSTAPSEVLATTTKVNTWETIYWNFAGKPSNVYNRLVIMFDFGRTGDGSENSTFYFDDIRLVSNALPVNILSFSATQINTDVQLNWNTANEINNKGFMVEKSKNGNVWQELVFIPAKATNGNGATYSAVDQMPTVGTHYYRLKQVDMDGKVSYSTIKAVNITTQNTKLFVYPIPAKEYVTIVVPEQRGKISYTITNTSGKTVSTGSFPIGNQPNKIVCNHLAKGCYFIKVVTDNQVFKPELLLIE